MNWKYVGIFLFVLWLFLTANKFISLGKRANFSYQRAYFGQINWYRNFRNWLLIIALLMVEIFASLKTIFLLFLVASIVFLVLCLRNLKFRIGRPSSSVWLSGLNLLLLIIASIFVFVL
ncbi:hypothetical protein LPAF129_01760 [Ligilactobacillus pabuli]|uniref:Uncharacterized protein n=1 Tax=Ligilactobacillus pabuli TaxID=2886039 RepID=A0ABQ5JF72_9LACO|nr:hypothetical protein [Ligilactobacillus pabuli]GKS80491.1 hypothetical protein LPAF129_01760 [Ligilactobacillus pabuli]HIW89143.1 hypothetical protein [Candidatus Ligilactobacillus excrementipullorum]